MLAQASGMQLAYRDVDGRRRIAPADVLLAVLTALGVVDGPRDIDDALERTRADRRRTVMAPVVVAWDGVVALELHVPSRDVRDHAQVAVELEDGTTVEQLVPVRVVPGSPEDGNEDRVALLGAVDAVLEPGVHQLHLRIGASTSHAHVIAAPTRCWRGSSPRHWGVFTPVYALRDGPDLGTGHLGHLARLGDWIADHGGDLVATLPLLPTYLDRPFDPSPYAPISRRHWNDALLDLTGEGSGACAIETGPAALVDWEKVGRITDGRLSEAAATLAPGRETQFREFLAARPDVDDFDAHRRDERREIVPYQLGLC